MWSKTYSKTVKGLSAERIWHVWTDINQWHTWQDDIEYAKLEGELKTGAFFQFKPKGGPKFKIELTDVKPNVIFTDVTRFPLAKMYDAHEIIVHGDELELKCTISITGPLAFFWRKFVAEGVANGAPEQIEKLIERARRG